MDAAAIYPELKGSRGEFHLQLPQTFLDDVCRLFQNKEVPYVGKITKIRVTPDSAIRRNRFRIQAEFIRDVMQSIGEVFLNVLRDGIEIQIDQPCATPANPRIIGSLVTGMVGSKMAVPSVVSAINQALGVDNALEVESKGIWWSWSSYQATLKLNPFVLVRRLIELFPAIKLPAHVVNHITHIELKTSDGAFHINVIWQHSGQVK